MFIRMLLGALIRKKQRVMLIILTVALGVSLATAMLNVMFDVGDKVNQELKAYGANLTILPKNMAVISDRYQFDDNAMNELSQQYITEDNLVKIKMIFWAYNIVDFAPYLSTTVSLQGESVPLIGTWFNRHLSIPTGDEVDTGMLAMKSWWHISGEPITDNDRSSIMIGANIAERYQLAIGDSVDLTYFMANDIDKKNPQTLTLTVKNIFHSGGVEDSQIYTPLSVVQQLTDKLGLVERVEVSALTTPENDLSRKAAQDPNSLSRAEWDIWYCTAYISSIAYQIEEVMPNVRVKAIMQVAQSEGSILDKTQLLMALLTILVLLSSALAIANLVTANVIERSNEIGLLKALGASNTKVAILLFTEILITALFGGILGYGVGIGFAQLIGQTIFNTWIEPKALIIPLVVVMVFIITLLASLPALRMMMFLRPKAVLHGR